MGWILNLFANYRIKKFDVFNYSLYDSIFEGIRIVMDGIEVVGMEETNENALGKEYMHVLQQL
jgi:hypothetical protein